MEREFKEIRVYPEEEATIVNAMSIFGWELIDSKRGIEEYPYSVSRNRKSKKQQIDMEIVCLNFELKANASLEKATEGADKLIVLHEEYVQELRKSMLKNAFISFPFNLVGVAGILVLSAGMFLTIFEVVIPLGITLVCLGGIATLFAIICLTIFQGKVTTFIKSVRQKNTVSIFDEYKKKIDSLIETEKDSIRI